MNKKDIEKFVLPLYAKKDAMHDINHIRRIIKTFSYLEKDYAGQFNNKATKIFGQEKQGDTIAGIVGNVMQSFAGHSFFTITASKT